MKKTTLLINSFFLLTSAYISPSIALAEEEEIRLNTIQVIGTKESAVNSDLAGSTDTIDREELKYEHVDETYELFNKAPGVAVSRFNQGIINTDISIRGFAGDGVTPHSKLLIDGIPANLHNGYGELDQLFPVAISSINIFKGTSDARYGTFNIAGNYNILTRQDDSKEVELTLGSFNAREIQSYFGDSSDGFKQNYSIGYRASDGYRDNTNLTKYSLTGSWQWDVGEENKLRLILRHSAYDADSPGYLTKEESRRKPTSSASYASEDGGDKLINHLSVHWSQRFSDSANWEFKTYHQTFERERWVRFSEAGSLQNRFDDQKQTGFISTIQLALSDTLGLDWGVDHESQDNIEQRFGTVGQARVRDSSNVIRDQSYTFNSTGTYIKINHDPSDQFWWNFAIRADQLSGDFKNKDTGETREMHDFGTIIQPKLNLVYAPSESLNIFANAGRSFQHPFGSSAYRADGDSNRDISFNDGWEVGTQLKSSKAIKVRVSYWEQKATNEFVTVDGTDQNVGETKRNGYDLSFNGELSDSLGYWGNYSYVDTEIVDGGDDNESNEGNKLRSIPDHTASLGVNLKLSEQIIARAHLDSQGSYYINEANEGGRFGEYTLVNVSADYNTSWGGVKFQINNLTNQYYEYVFDFSDDGSGSIHSPGDGINGSISVNYKI